MEVDPLSLVTLIQLARSYLLANRFADGLSATEKALGLRNDDDAAACSENAVESCTGPVLWIPVEPPWCP